MLITLLTIFLSSFMIALSGALMPGPMLTVTISESVHRGTRTGPLMILGHGILELLLVVGLVCGLAPYISGNPVFITISLTGGVILLWMGLQMLKSVPGIRLTYSKAKVKEKNMVLAGAVMSIINPYWFIWWATIGLGYIIQTMQLGISGIASFFAGHIFADLAWYTLVSFAVSRGKNILTDSHYKILVGCCGSFLLVFSCWFFYSGITRLLTTGVAGT